MPPLPKRLDDGMKFFGISGVPLSNDIKFLTEEGNQVAFLTKHPSNASVRGITHNFEYL